MLRPELLMSLLGEERLKNLATGVEETLREAVDEAVH
jgi:hypothetical protein